MTLGQMTPGLSALGLAREAGYAVFETLDRVPPIDSSSPEGEKPSVEGRLEFREVRFHGTGCNKMNKLIDYGGERSLPATIFHLSRD